MESVINSTIKILPIRTKQETDDYPYGRLRTTAYFSIEFVAGKGFRHVFQTVNPKNGRLNAEKKSTYSNFMYLVKNTENGHYETRGFGIGGFEDIGKLAKFLNENGKALDLSDEMVKEICCTMFAVSKISTKWVDADTDKVLAIIDAPVKAMVQGFKSGTVNWLDVVIDVVAIDNLKEEKKAISTDQSNFRSTSPVSLMSMIAK